MKRGDDQISASGNPLIYHEHISASHYFYRYNRKNDECISYLETSLVFMKITVLCVLRTS